MSIVRIGLGETKNFAEGYDAIFAKKEKKEVKPEEKPQADQAKPADPKVEKKK